MQLTNNNFKLREDFDSGADVILTDEVSVHDVATILKEFFRDLPEPLLPREVYHPLLAVQSKSIISLQLGISAPHQN